MALEAVGLGSISPDAARVFASYTSPYPSIFISIARMASVERAYYSASIPEFLRTSDAEVEGRLAVASVSDGFPPVDAQLAAWRGELSVLRASLEGRRGKVYFEFAIPRMGRRADIVLLLESTILVLEFKVGASEFSRSARDQAWDYALDLKNFHEPSHDASIIPVVIATEAPNPPAFSISEAHEDGVWPPLLATPTTLSRLIDAVTADVAGEAIDPTRWEAGRYSPTPTIIEAALALYNNHSVIEISRSDAGARNLTATSRTLERIIQATRARNEKSICFVTGVPGAGKTLVGLNIATTYMDTASELYSVYLSGNGPLVSVLSEALSRDRAARLRRVGERKSLVECRSEVKAFIQNVHHFRDEYWRDKDAPIEHVAIFDEAQRAWTLEQTSKFMARRKNVADFAMSEPEFLISCMDRHDDWSVVICLVGAGQEINTGEAGLAEWFGALNRS
ncbi:MAG TPA: DNA/RNA helicase domain-containing protein, partial [Thermoplasmata archaeon]|nr:DNA/RNA helicase domain-containing protein [Thermoplasmata archaeon]